MVRLQIPINFRKGKRIMDMFEEFWYVSAVLYSKINPFMIRHFGIDKVGFFLRKIKRPRAIRVDGLLFQFDPDVSTSFGNMLGGRFNEKETHKLLRRVIENFDRIDLFVDVGSNIGEFVIDIASLNQVRRIVGFEPNFPCTKSCLKSIKLNGIKKAEIRQKVLKDSREPVRFDMTGENANAHSIFTPPTDNSSVIYSSTIDDEFADVGGRSILLIDVEGAEVLVLTGARRFVDRNIPFIIFEYNFVSKRYFSLEDVRKLLPAGYDIFRLRMEDGFLDRNMDDTWNCVAVHKNSPFYPVALELVR